MAIPNPGGNVYKRDTPEDLHQAWNAVIRKVNDERGSPPEDTNCEALDPIDEVEADHIWIKQDVEDVRAAIDEMCEYAWIEDLKYWKDEIITEIEEALDREWGGWGDEGECCEEECLADCDNACGRVEIYVGSYMVTACLANPTESYCTSAQREPAEEAGGKAIAAISDWIDFWGEYCVLVDEVKDLEKELEQLEEELAALEIIRDEECAKPLPNRCAQRQAAVDAKQAEVDAKQAELDAKEAERDAKKAEADAAEATADAEAASSIALADDAVPPGCQLYYSSLPGSEPWTNTACDELGPECLGRDPARCHVSWRVERKTHQYFCFGGEYHGNWGFEMGGGYTMSGQPYVGNIRACSGIDGYACVSSGPNPCTNPSCGTGCTSYKEQEVRLILSYPDPTLEGETCCD